MTKNKKSKIIGGALFGVALIINPPIVATLGICMALGLAVLWGCRRCLHRSTPSPSLFAEAARPQSRGDRLNDKIHQAVKMSLTAAASTILGMFLLCGAIRIFAP